MEVWLLAIDKKYSSYEELKYRKVLAQGWSKIGDLSPLLPIKDSSKFKDIINKYVDYIYEDWNDSRNPGRILYNLLDIKKGDYVICCEGEKVKGIAYIEKELKYYFDNANLYEYCQTVFPVTNWKDVKDQSHKISLKSRGPVGIQKYGGNKDYIVNLFNA